MRPKPLVLTATATEAVEQFGPALRVAMMKNIGANDVYIDFDNPVDANNSYVLEAGETLTRNTNGGSTTFLLARTL